MITVESIKNEYPNVITADANEGLIRVWLEELPADKKTITPWDDLRHFHVNSYVGDDVIETEEQYPQCNYCVGGALQMAFGEVEPSLVDDWTTGVFPASELLADTLHYYCEIPYGYEDYLINHDIASLSEDYPCPFPEHNSQDCFRKNSTGETAYELADEITRANDRGDFDYAWSCVEIALEYKEKS